MKIIAIFLLLISILSKGPDPYYTLVKIPIETGARCLDGTQSGLYYSIGSDANKNKIMIYFNSGGLCTGTTLTQTLQSCYRRSSTSLGSTKNAKPTRTFDGEGLLSAKQAQNPVFYDWTRIYIIYCDGSQYQGSRENPIQYKDVNLYFRGANNTIENFNYLGKNLGLYQADTVVITGVSAGGLATYFWSNYVYERSNNKRVFSMPDSGIFIVDYINPFTKQAQVLKNVRNLINLISSEVPLSMPQCEQEFQDKVLCFNAGNLAKYLKTPFFIIQSQYDQWSVENILGIPCALKATPGSMAQCSEIEIKALEDYRTATLQVFEDFASLPYLGIWSPTCIQHGFSDTSLSFNSDKYQIPTTTGIKLSEAMKRFIDDPYNRNHFYIDDKAWPGNQGCSGLYPVRFKNNLKQELD